MHLGKGLMAAVAELDKSFTKTPLATGERGSKVAVAGSLEVLTVMLRVHRTVDSDPEKALVVEILQRNITCKGGSQHSMLNTVDTQKYVLI